MGFGKTTIAKQLEHTLPAVRFTHDELMLERFGRNPSDFQTKYQTIDDEIRSKTAECIKNGQNVILDYGFWDHKKREEYYNWAQTLTDVIFHYIKCDMNIAKQRVLERSLNNSDHLWIDEEIFEKLSKQYEAWHDIDDYPVVLHNASTEDYIGKKVHVQIDRPLKSKHPKYGFEYPVNYGFISYTKSGDGEELDAYILMIDKPLTSYIGRCIGVIHRTDDDDDKLIVVPEASDLEDEVIEESVAFQEKWFKHTLIRHP